MIKCSRQLCWWLLVVASACSPSTPPARSSSWRDALRPVALPDVARAADPVARQLHDRYASLTAKMQDPAAAPAMLGQEFGEMGRLLMAAGFLDAAEPFLLDAQLLLPNDVRWPYYLAHLYRGANKPMQSAALFERALELRPDDLPSLIWLGSVHVDQGELDKALPPLRKAISLNPRSPAALFRLGGVALARKEYDAAVRYLEETLAADPQASIAHYPLAMAYRGLGDTARAEEQLRQRGDTEVTFPDPLMRDMRAALASALSFERMGLEAMSHEQWAEAEAEFRRGLDVDPDNPSIRHRLGTVLVVKGDAAGAMREFQETLRRSPDYAKAHYSLGLLLSSNGQHVRALEEFSDAVRIDLGYAEARFEQAIALARVGRYAESRDQLSEGMKANPALPVFAHALARLLAASPDDSVRDGRRAVEIAMDLQTRFKSAEVFETLAMALAAAGRFDQAIELQRQVMGSAQRARRADVLPRLSANLALYERRQPSRTPWARDEPVAATLAVK